MSTKTIAKNFVAKNQNNETIELKNYLGKRLVLYFYPKDDTPGCTREAIAFSEKKEAFNALNTQIIGVSKDSVESHQKFCDKYELSIDLISDPELGILNDYGVWQEKKNYGKTYMGIVRSTFVIDESGMIVKSWKSVSVDGHVDEVLAFVQGLSS